MNTEQQLALLREQLAQLTQRIFRLEQMLGERTAVHHEPAAAAVAHPQAAPPPLRVDVGSTPPPPPPTQLVEQLAARAPQASAPEPVQQPAESLESRIGSRWLNRVGIVAVLTGVSYFLKYAFENNWIGPTMRVLIGLAAGVGFVWWSESFRRKDYKAFSYSLKAVGVGILYLSLWAAFHMYALVPQWAAFFAMVLVTAGVAWLALAQDAELLMGLALIGGFLTPVLAGRDVNAEGTLLSYLLMLDAAALILQRFRTWPRIVGSAWLGTLMLYVAWRNEWYEQAAFGETFLFITGFFAVFAAVPLITRLLPKGKLGGFPQLIVLVLPIANSLAFFGELSGILPAENHNHILAGYTMALAAVMAGLGFAMLRREQEAGDKQGLMSGLHWAIAAVFAVIAVPLRFHGNALTVGWLAEGALLYWVGAAGGRRLLRAMGAIVALLGTFEVVTDTWDKVQTTVVWNERFALYLGAIAVIAFVVWREGKAGSEETEPLRAIGLLLIVGLALGALNLEVHDYWSRREWAMPMVPDWAQRMAMHAARDCWHFAMWLLVGAATYASGAQAKKLVLRVAGSVVAAVGIIYLLIQTTEMTQPMLLLNERFAMYLLAVAFLGMVVWLERREAGEVEWPVSAVIACIGLNILALFALCLEARDVFALRIGALQVPTGTAGDPAYWHALRGLEIARDFSYSAIAMAYGAALMWLGFARRTALLRWQALVLMGVASAKVFTYDVSYLDKIYRILSFIVLGGILLAISFAYQKDWLGLQRKHAVENKS